MIKMKKCEYCGKEISYHEIYCSDECQRMANRHYDRTSKFLRLFYSFSMVGLIGLTIGLFLMSFARFMGGGLAIGCCLLLAALLFVLPMPTQGMIRKRGIKKAEFISRMVGFGFIAIALLVAGLMIWL